MCNTIDKIDLLEEDEKLKEKLKELYSAARKQTPETFPSFMQELIANYAYDYGTITHALAAAAIGAASALDSSDVGGITGFQAGFVMWNFVKEWYFPNNKCGLKIVDYDEFLYPQYRDKFEKALNKSTWDAIQEQAKKYIDEDNSLIAIGGNSIHAHPNVRKHWEKIAAGEVPFGFYVKGDK